MTEILLTRTEQRAKLRAQLIKELLGTPTKKRRNKLHCAIRKKNGKSKFLANPNKHKAKGEKREW